MAATITTNTANNPFLTRAYNVSSPEACKALYEEWAERFNDDVLGEAQGYVAPAFVAQAVLAANGKIDGELLDCGCGTGLAGVALAQAGAKNIDGNDYSPGMLKVASKTGLYRELKEVDLTKEMSDVSEDKYDVVTCVGTLTHGHVGPSPALKEFVRVSKKGGIIATTILSDIWASGGYEAEVERLRDSGSVEVVSTKEEWYRKAAGVKARIVVLRKR